MFIPGLRKAALEGTKEFDVYAVNKEGKAVSFQVALGDMADAERRIIVDGCLINYYRNHPAE